MPHTTPFGVGSFHFSWKPAPLQPANIESYVAALTKALNSIPTISNVQFRDTDEEDDGFEWDGGTEPPDWGEGEGYYPSLDFFNLTFDIFIPKRLQDELFERPYLETGTETFRVHVRYGFESPVTFVCPQAPTDDHDPSLSVMLVREYLAREFATPREGISFQCLGPSPFHADFFLEDGGTGLSPEHPFVGGVEETDSYDQVYITYDATIHDSLDDALDELFFELSGQLSTAYAVCAADARAIRRWESLMAEVDRLVGPGPRTYPQRIKGAVLRGRALSRLHQTLAEFERDAVEDSQAIERSRRQLYRSEPAVSLRPLVDAEIDDRWQFPIAQVEKLVSHIEAKHSQQVELLVVVLASIVGGVVGSLLTLLVQ
jgi:hypothetical protein